MNTLNNNKIVNQELIVRGQSNAPRNFPKRTNKIIAHHRISAADDLPSAAGLAPPNKNLHGLVSQMN
jgi:hypothetical protein